MEEPQEESINAEVYVIEPLGNETIVDVKLGQNVIKVLAEPDFPVTAGQKIWLRINRSKLHFFHDQSRQCFYHASGESTFQIS
ncbi:MAG: TOBE domain-containing protein [candidate division Zixibacteria bacterium]|nr:TOBE domain-containing protein [candidate division Zixibacteria bacterium]